MVWIVGGVFSQGGAEAGLSGLWGPMAFHAVTMAVGSYLVARSRQPVPAG